MARNEGGRSALLLGSTGLVGRHCLELLLTDSAYARVVTLTRRPPDRHHPRLEERRVDFDRLTDHGDLFEVDHLFCCLGTTIRVAGSREAFRRVDVEYPAVAAKMAAARGASVVVAVSAVGANPRSPIFYNRAKGEMEESVQRLGPRSVWFVRPALLLGQRTRPRPGERLAELVMRPLSPLMIGPLRRFRPVSAADVAAAMLLAAGEAGSGGVIESEAIPTAANSYRAAMERKDQP